MYHNPFKYQTMAQIFKFNLRSIPILSVILVAFFALGPLACVDLTYDQPPAGGVDPNIPVNITIADLKSRHVLGKYEPVTDDVTFSALVISDDLTGNFYKQLVVQDATGGIELRVDMLDIYNIYPVGRKVYVKAKGLTLGDYNGLTQLGAGYDNVLKELIRIPESILAQYVIPATYGNPVNPTVKDINGLTTADVSTLVKFENVQFVSADAGQTYADPVLQATLNREIENCAHQRVIVRTSGYSTFAGELTPTSGGTLVGVLSIFGTTYQLTIRDLNDVAMPGDRCTVIIDENFETQTSNVDISLPDWANIAVKGTRVWRGKSFSGNLSAQATSFGDQAAEMETWLITPSIVLSVPKKITFESAQSHWVHDGLSVWISSNFNGTDVAGATWTQLSPALAGSSTADDIFVPSGDIDLSGYTGTVRIGFKYVGSGPNGQTTSFRIDNVKVTAK